MRKITWKTTEYGNIYWAKIGKVSLSCDRWETKTGKYRWNSTVILDSALYGIAAIDADSRDIPDAVVSIIRHGRKRTCLSRAQEDAVEVARELMIDLQEGLTREMANFDLIGLR